MRWNEGGRLLLAVIVATTLAARAASAQTSRVSINTGEQQANADSSTPSVSGNGRFITFESAATNLVSGDTNGAVDIFLRDRGLGRTVLVSVSSDEARANGASSRPIVSRDGRYVVFNSLARNLVDGDTNGARDVFVRDAQFGTTSRVSVGRGGQANGESRFNSISGNGRHVTFASLATNLVAGDTNGTWDVFVRDRRDDATMRVSVGRSGGSPNGSSIDAVISASGRFVAFTSDASNLVAGDTNGMDDVFVRDRNAGTRRVSVGADGRQGDRDSAALAISEDGRYVVFTSASSTFVPNDSNGQSDIFVNDRSTGRTTRVSLTAQDGQSNGTSDDAAITPSGRFVAFRSSGTNLVPGDTNGSLDVFLRDRESGTTRRISQARTGGATNASCFDVAVSDNADQIVFSCSASNVVANDTNGDNDVFLRPR